MRASVLSFSSIAIVSSVDEINSIDRRDQTDVIVNVTDHTSFTVPYRLDLPTPPREGRPPVKEMKAAGIIQVLLFDPLKGVVNGVLLSDGTQVRLPPDVGEDFQAS